MCYSSAVLLWFFGHGSEDNVYDARTTFSWQLQFSSISPLRTQVQDDNNIHLLLTETTNLVFLLIQALKFIVNSLCLVYAHFLDALYLYFDLFRDTGHGLLWLVHCFHLELTYSFPVRWGHLCVPHATIYATAVSQETCKAYKMRLLWAPGFTWSANGELKYFIASEGCYPSKADALTAFGLRKIKKLDFLLIFIDIELPVGCNAIRDVMPRSSSER